MRIALLAAFPLHVIPGSGVQAPSGHFATWLPQLAEAFATIPGLEIHWLVTTRGAAPAEPIRWQGQTFHLLSVPNRGRILRGFRKESRALGERLRQVQPDLVHAWGSEDCYALSAARCPFPWLLSMQGILQEYVRRVPMPWPVHVLAFYEKLALRQAREVVTESKWASEVMARYAPQARRRVVEYGVQPIFFETPWQPDPTRPVAIFAGTPEPRKGLEDAVLAFADPALAHAELRIIGGTEGAYAREWQRRSTPNVRWQGRGSVAETAQALARAWCLVLPTRADTGPMIVKEARTMGLPVISTPCSGARDYIQPGVNGFLCEPGDVSAIRQALGTILGDFALAKKMGSAQWDEQRAEFHPAKTAARFVEIYHELLSAAGAR